MKRIEQRNPFDCGVACLAMLTGKAPEDIEAMLGYRPAETTEDLDFGVIPDEAVAVLVAAGRQPVWTCTTLSHEAFAPARTVASLPRRRLIPRPDDLHHFAAGKEAMFNVASRMAEGGSHWIAWDGQTVFDPVPHGRRYVAADLANPGVEIYGAVVCLDRRPMLSPMGWDYAATDMLR